MNPHHITASTQRYLDKQLTLTNNRQLHEEITQFQPRNSDFGNIEDHIVFDTPEVEIIKKKRWVRDVLKQHGRVTRVRRRVTPIEEWNIGSQRLSGALNSDFEDDPHRDSLTAEEDRSTPAEVIFKTVELEYVETSNMLAVNSPEAIIWFDSYKFEEALHICEVLDDMHLSQRVIELYTLEKLSYCVQWTIEDCDPMFSVLQQLSYPKQLEIT